MAKRFTDTELWDQEWFMNLNLRDKLLTKAVRDKCDIAGIYKPNMLLLSMYIGEKVTLEDIIKVDNGRQFKLLDNGKIYCIGFIEFQYGAKLNERSPVHSKIISILAANGIENFENFDFSLKNDENLNRVSNRVLEKENRVSNTLQEKEEEEEEEKEEEKEKEKEKEEEKEKNSKKKKISENENFGLAKVEKEISPESENLVEIRAEMMRTYQEWFFNAKGFATEPPKSLDWVKLSKIRESLTARLIQAKKRIDVFQHCEAFKLILEASKSDEFIFIKNSASLPIIESRLNYLYDMVINGYQNRSKSKIPSAALNGTPILIRKPDY